MRQLSVDAAPFPSRLHFATVSLKEGVIVSSLHECAGPMARAAAVQGECGHELGQFWQTDSVGEGVLHGELSFV